MRRRNAATPRFASGSLPRAGCRRPRSTVRPSPAACSAPRAARRGCRRTCGRRRTPSPRAPSSAPSRYQRRPSPGPAPESDSRRPGRPAHWPPAAPRRRRRGRPRERAPRRSCPGDRPIPDRRRARPAARPRRERGRRRDADLGGARRQRLVDLGGEPLVRLDEVVALHLVAAGEPRRLLRGRDAPAAHRHAGQVQVRSQQEPALDGTAQSELRWVPLHAAHGRHAVGDVQEQEVLDVLVAHAGVRQVPVHLGQPRHQVVSVGFHDLDAVRRLDVLGVVDRPDAPLVDDDRLAGNHPLAVHRHDVDVDERQVALDHQRRRAAGACRGGETRQEHHRRRVPRARPTGVRRPARRPATGRRGCPFRTPACASGHARTSGRGRALAYSGTCPRL